MSDEPTKPSPDRLMAEWLTAQRKKFGLTQKQFAKAAGLSVSTVHRLEQASLGAWDALSKSSSFLLIECLGVSREEFQRVSRDAGIEIEIANPNRGDAPSPALSQAGSISLPGVTADEVVAAIGALSSFFRGALLDVQITVTRRRDGEA